MLEYLMVLRHQQLQCSLQNHTFSTGYPQATVAMTLCSAGAQSKLNKDKVQKSQMDGTEQC